MEHIKVDLVKRLNQRSLGTMATAAHICHVANQLATGRYTAVSFKNGSLTLAARTPGAAQNLRFESTTVLRQINSALSAPLITAIRITVRPL